MKFDFLKLGFRNFEIRIFDNNGVIFHLEIEYITHIYTVIVILTMVRFAPNICPFLKKDGTICNRPCIHEKCSVHMKCPANGNTVHCTECNGLTHSKYKICERCARSTFFHTKLCRERAKHEKRILKQINLLQKELEQVKIK